MKKKAEPAAELVHAPTSEGWIKRNSPGVLKGQIILVAIATVVAGLVFSMAMSYKLGIPSAVRDVVAAEYAHILAGPRIPVDPKVVDYEEAHILPSADTWSTITNSVWLSDIVRRIVPYFYYDGISTSANPGRQVAAIYPLVIYFSPMPDQANFHLLGEEHMDVVETPFGYERGPVIQLNERMVVGDATDMRVLLSTIIHENVHGQGGNFTFSGTCPDPTTEKAIECWKNESAALESNAQTATLEVLASYCDHQNELACKTFWFEVSNAAASSFQVWTWEHNVPWLYDFLDKHLWLTSGQSVQYDASMRYWAQYDPEGLKEIVSKYGDSVWDKTLKGVTSVWKLPTGNFGLVKISANAAWFQESLMTFDDVKYQFGGLFSLLLKILS